MQKPSARDVVVSPLRVPGATCIEAPMLGRCFPERVEAATGMGELRTLSRISVVVRFLFIYLTLSVAGAGEGVAARRGAAPGEGE